MNQEIRKLLIDRAISDRPIYYGEIMKLLGLTGGVDEDHQVLSETLANISRFENANKRPLLSSIAMYSPETTRRKQGETHGNGFFDLAESLGFGNKAKLKRDMFVFTEIARCREYWSNKEHFETFYDLHNDSVETGIPTFFTQDEINFFSEWAGKVYNPEEPRHVAAKNYIMEFLGSKTVYWSNQLVSRLPGFETFNWRMWNQRGWESTENGKVRVARFKPYTWARIYRSGDTYKDIFFTVGVDAATKSLVYKLDYYFEKNSELSADQKALCEQLIPDEVSRIEIPFAKLPNYSWQLLINESFHFINNNIKIYDEIIQSVWNEVVNVSSLMNRLVKRNPPDDGFDVLPSRNFSFQGTEVDWPTHVSGDMETGTIGEELVLEYEKKRLMNAGLVHYASEVVKQKDGVGYDIFSRNLDGSEKKIEVKTTTGGAETPFIISLPEITFSSLNADSFALYRVYNLNKERRVAEFYEYCGDIRNHFLFEGISFRAYNKKK